MGEIAPGVHRIDGLKGGQGTANVYLLVDGDALALIDAGLPGNLRTIAAYVEGIGKGLEQLRYILLTHSHPDHTGGAPALRERTGATILAHPDDVRSNGRKESVSYFGMFGASPLPLPFLRRVPAYGLLSNGEELPLLGVGYECCTPPGTHREASASTWRAWGPCFAGTSSWRTVGFWGKTTPFQALIWVPTRPPWLAWPPLSTKSSAQGTADR